MEKCLGKRQLLILIFILATINIYSQTFVEQTGITLTGVSSGSVAWGDYDRDGFLDILIVGSGTSKVYKNNGNNTFSEQAGITSTLDGVFEGASAWGDYNNDGYLDILLNGSTDGTPGGVITKIYKNNGNNTFSEIIGNNIEGVMSGSAAWGDYDNDGDLDFVLMGQIDTGYYVTKIYKNNGADKFEEQLSIQLKGIRFGSLNWGDYDNDGWLDLIQTGTGRYAVTRLYHNNGDNTFTLNPIFYNDWYTYGTPVWNDYNNDGRLDLLICGYQGVPKSIIYQQNIDTTFTKQRDISITGVSYSSAAWGDYDNDGFADILVSGTTNGVATGRVSKLFKNNGDNSFVEMSAGLTGLINTSVAWGDYDNDGDLDILLSGSDGSSDITKIYRNEASSANIQPDAPVILSPQVSGGDVNLSWRSVGNDVTPDKAMTYNLMVGTSSGSGNILAPHALVSNGFHCVPAMGNAQLDTIYQLNNLSIGTYYWRVQAIDNGYKGGVFSFEGSFTISTTSQATNISPSNTRSFSTLLQWARGTGSQCAVFMKEADAGTASPVNGSTYTDNILFGIGSQIGSTGWYCVYKGTQDSVTVTNLKANTTYMVHVCEMTGPTTYLSSTDTKNPEIITTDLFSGQSQFDFIGSYQGNATWGDYNNDGYLDFIVGNSNSSKIYKNNGNNTFTLQTAIIIAGTSGGMVAWGDYNNDGFLDVATIGSGYSKIYKNNRNNTFSDQNPPGMDVMGTGSVAWADFENDGDLDIIFCGAAGSQKMAKIFRNNGDSTFTEQPGISLPGLQTGKVITADYNNDGYKDICIGGELSTGYDTQIFINNRDFTFTFQPQIDLGGIRTGDASWGDFNNDGNMDLFLTGMYAGSSLYENNGNNTFSLINTPAITSMYSDAAVASGDYDNDGDLDLIISGNSQIDEGYVTNVYRNDGSGIFIKMKSIHIDACGRGSISFADYDNDNDLDLIINGLNNDNGSLTKIFRNNNTIANVKPAVPDGLNETIAREGVTFEWDPVTSDATPAKSISYNIRVGKTSGNGEIISSHSAPDGFRRLSAYGNLQNNSSFLLKKLSPGTYYWSVQAIDNGFAGSAFAAERTFTVASLQAQKLTAQIVDENALFLKWQRGNGERCVVFCKQGIDSDPGPVNNTTYLADNTLGYGSQIETNTGWYCVFNGRADSVLLNGLAPNNSYTVHVIEYSGEAGSENYYTTTSISNPGVFETTLLSEQISMSFTDRHVGSAAFADYNNDMHLDIIVTGSIGGDGNTQLYKNNGDNTFTDQTLISIVGVVFSDVAWADYDNDGFLDLLITGATEYASTSYNPVTKLYHNDGGTGFSESGVPITAVTFASVKWGDYNKDGFIDFAIAGAAGDYTVNYDPITEIYKNNGNGTFTPLNISLPGVYQGEVDWGDYDNDGDLDLLIAGNLSSGNICTIYQNKGNDTFEDQTSLSLFINGPPVSAAWGDYNKDGYLDLIIAGGAIRIYKNNGPENPGFTLQADNTIPNIYTKVKWCDFNNDGFLDFASSGNSSGPIPAKIFLYMGNDRFAEYPNVPLPGTDNSFIACGDYDNDGDNDLFLGGFSAGGYLTSMYRNNIIMNAGDPAPNTIPVAPTGLAKTAVPGGVNLNWNPVKSNEANYNSLSYNLKLTNTDDNSNANSSHNLVSGTRTMVDFGNCYLDTFMILKLPEGNYSWTVQAVDQMYAGGDWSAEETFFVRNTQAFFDTDTVCQGLATQFTDLSVATDGIASWEWDFKDGSTSTLQNPIHSYTTAGSFQVRLVVTSNISGIKDSIDQFVVVKPIPIAGFTAPSVCIGTSSDITNISNENSLSITSWEWWFGDGQTSSVRDPITHPYSLANTYDASLKVTADNGCSDSISQNVIVAPLPAAAVSIVGNTSFCLGDSVRLSVPVQSNTTYQWQIDSNNILDATSNEFTVKNTDGNYTAMVSNTQASGCSVISIPTEITVWQVPLSPYILSSGDTVFCQGDSLVLSVTHDPEYTYYWKLGIGAVGDNSNTLSAKSSGIYSLDISNLNDCNTSSSNTIEVVVNPNPSVPTVTVNGNSDLCEEESAELSVENDASMSYQWLNETISINGETSNSYTASTIGNYILEVSNSFECSSETDPVGINVKSAPSSPTISNSGNDTFCEGDSIILSVSPNPDYFYQWFREGGTFGLNQNTLTVKSSGEYTLQVANIELCEAFAVNQIAVNMIPKPTEPSVTVNGDPTFCEGVSVELISADNPALSYQWIKDGNNINEAVSSSFIASLTGSYSLQVSNNEECMSQSAFISVISKAIPVAPTISVSGNTVFCEGESLGLSVSNNSDLTYQWLKGDGSIGLNENILTVYSTGEYSLRIQNGLECNATSDTISVIVKPAPGIPTINQSGPLTFCSGESVTLSVTDNPDLVYQWLRNGGTIGLDQSSFTASVSGDYFLRLSNSDECSIMSDAISVVSAVAPSSPTIIPSGNTEFCEGESVTLSVIDNPDITYNWLFYDTPLDSDQNSIIVSDPGDYSLEIFNFDLGDCGASSVNKISVIVNPLPTIPSINFKGDSTLCEGESLTFIISNPGTDDYQWMNELGGISGETGTSFIANETGTYSLKVTNSNMCNVESIEYPVIVYSYPNVPVIEPENYTMDDCQNEDPVVLSIVGYESGVNYQWFLYNNRIDLANDFTYSGYLEGGSYTVEAERNGCDTISEPLIIRYGDMPEKPEILAEGPVVWYLASSNDSATSYRWYYESERIEGATDYLYVAGQQMGKYEVSISNAGGCFAKSNPIWIPLGTGIAENPFQNLRIYPNPTPGIFTLEMDNPIMGDLIIDIYTEEGKQVLNIKFTKNNSHFRTEINLSGQGNGLYLLSFLLESKYKAQRTIVVE